jgi:hypothetical protein
VVTALLGPGQIEVLLQQVEQRGPRVDRQLVLDPVDPQSQVGVHRRFELCAVVGHQA